MLAKWIIYLSERIGFILLSKDFLLCSYLGWCLCVEWIASLKRKSTANHAKIASVRQFDYLSLLAFTPPIKAPSNAALLDNIITA